MNNLAFTAFKLAPQHATAEEYANWLSPRLRTAAAIDTSLDDQLSFIRKYPDLNTWLEIPLEERVGRLWGQKVDALTNKVSYKARSYLYFLVIQGYVQMDWEWLIAVGHLEVWHLLQQAKLDMELPQLLEQAIKLGYNAIHAETSLKWTFCRIFLHIGSAERYHSFLKSAGTHLHLLQAALYHLGRADQPPRKRGVPNKLKLTLKPLMDAVLTRYLELRSLTDRPSTLTKLDLSIRQFGVWLARHHPNIESFAQVTREHALEFALAIQTLPNERDGKPLAASTKKGRLHSLAGFFRDVSGMALGRCP